MVKKEPASEELKELITFLKMKSREEKAKIWRRVAELLSRSKRKRIVVNLSKIDRLTGKGEYVIVPGKVLGGGTLKHEVNVAAYSFSKRAVEKIVEAKGRALKLTEIAELNPKGSNIKILR